MTSQKLGSSDFCQIPNIVLDKGKSDKAKLLATNFSKNSNLDDSNNVLAAFPSRTNLKPHNIHVTSKLVKMVRNNLNSSEISGPDCIPFSGSEELRT